VDRFGRHHQGLAGLDGARRLPLDQVLKFPLENVDDLLAGVKSA
jgi:hypothetical protein